MIPRAKAQESSILSCRPAFHSASPCRAALKSLLKGEAGYDTLKDTADFVLSQALRKLGLAKAMSDITGRARACPSATLARL